MRYVITFSPPVHCEHYNRDLPTVFCHRLANVGIYVDAVHDTYFPYPAFFPMCPEHGFFAADDEVDELEARRMHYESIARYVQWKRPGSHDIEVESVDPSIVEGWEQSPQVDRHGWPLDEKDYKPDRAWYIRGIQDGSPFAGWAVWSRTLEEFRWFEQSSTMYDRSRSMQQ